MSKKELVPDNYNTVHLPSHHRAWKNGCVYEHILIAEQKLGRELKDGECVHHIDENKRNNDPNNLMIFDTYENHIAFHHGGKAIPLEDGTYTVIPLYKYEVVKKRDGSGFTKRKIVNNIDELKKPSNLSSKHSMDLCPICNKNFKHINASMCLECFKKDNIKHIPSKEKLINDFINNNSNKSAVARINNVEQTTIRNWCKRYGIKDCLININMSKPAEEREQIWINNR